MASIDIGANRQRLETNRVTTPMKPPMSRLKTRSLLTNRIIAPDYFCSTSRRPAAFNPLPQSCRRVPPSWRIGALSPNRGEAVRGEC